MKDSEIIEAIEKGELKLEKHELGTYIYHKKIYSKTKGEIVEYPKLVKGKIKMIKQWLGDFESYKQEKRKKVQYLAMGNKNTGYKITRKLYERCLMSLSSKD